MEQYRVKVSSLELTMLIGEGLLKTREVPLWMRTHRMEMDVQEHSPNAFEIVVTKGKKKAK